MLKLLTLGLLVALLSACVAQQTKDDPYADLKDIIPTKEKDSGPSKEIDMSHIPDAVPVYEPRRRAGNISPYKVKGKVYHVMTEASGFSETGIASWYGNKFHGNLTSNGERYDMYGMTAAHKSLPLPCFVKVTNLTNGKTVVVRVNDRGPFAHGRIIDLSYAAAQRLDYVQQGTAKVRIEYIEVPAPTGEAVKVAGSSQNATPVAAPSAPAKEAEPNKRAQVISNNSAAHVSESVSGAVAQLSGQASVNSASNTGQPQRFLQVGAYSTEAAALTTQFQLGGLLSWPVVVEALQQAGDKQIYRVSVGPLPDDSTLEIVQKALLEQAQIKSIPVTRKP
ncbi:septal ring lytic transglycosylase RlpA family protein [Agaribacterium sp. ZY112]|uniref:septal ring lytic transglycosylase RlpA family protein n=1 Tax=Agaribacterium sp. ZY112 TaxID=3233574 RepID=UPI0035268EC4